MAETQHAHAHPNYMVVFWLLVILTGASFVTFFLSANSMAILLFVMLVAVCKASLVGMFFMHLKFEGPWKYVVLIPAGLLLVMLVIALVPDVGLRGLH
jgi:cytochrome c oxidase subunit 4